MKINGSYEDSLENYFIIISSLILSVKSEIQSLSKNISFSSCPYSYLSSVHIDFKSEEKRKTRQSVLLFGIIVQ